MDAFHENHGENLLLLNDDRTAILREEDEAVFGDTILFSHKPLIVDKTFKIRIKETVRRAGWLNIGVTTRNPDDFLYLPKWGWELQDTWIQDGHTLYEDGQALEQLAQRLEVEPGDPVAIRLTEDGDLRIAIKGFDQGVKFTGLPTNIDLWAVVVPAWIRCLSTDSKLANPFEKVETTQNTSDDKPTKTCLIS